MAELIIRSGKQQGKKLVLPAARVVIGRDASCQIRLASNDVSRQHCSLRVSPEGVFARDLGSRNGTLVNDVPISHETLLKPGDIVRIGPIVLEVPKPREVPKPPAESAPAGGPDSSATDDDIVAWLSDEDPAAEADPGDTTIISKRTKVTPQPAAPKSATGRKQFKSIAEEAADIIRRHRASERKAKEQ